MGRTGRPQRDANPKFARLERESCLVNLAGDYRYLTVGYYLSQDLEVEGQTAHPTCQEALDGYVVPLFLEKARLAGQPTSRYYITNGYFEPPVLVDTLNPFMSRQSVVLKGGHQERVAKSMTRNFTYAICCQELPEGARIRYFRALLGWSPSPRYRALAAAVWEVFRIPLAVVRVIAAPDGALRLSGLRPLPFDRLTERERAHVEEVVTWRT